MSDSSSSSSVAFQLLCTDGASFDVDAEAAQYIGLLREMQSNAQPSSSSSSSKDKSLELPSSISGQTLKKVLEWVQRHKQDPPPDEDYEIAIRERDDFPDQWTEDFFKVDQVTLFAIVHAANFLHIKQLLDACCKNIAGMIRGKNVEELRSFFGAPDDLTEAEKAAIAKENEWLIKDN